MRRHVLLIAMAFGCGSTQPSTPDASTPGPGADAGSTGGTAGSDGGRIVDRPPFPDAGVTRYQCEVGVTDDLGAWAPLESGGDVPIGGAGQTGLTARPALRVSGVDPGDEALSAIVQLVLVNVETGVSGDSRPWDQPVLLACDDQRRCERAPVIVEVSHLAKLPELEGTVVEVRARVLDPDDPSHVWCQASVRGVLSRT